MQITGAAGLFRSCGPGQGTDRCATASPYEDPVPQFCRGL